MIASIEISLFPLDKNYSPFIRSFLDALNKYHTIRIKVQPMSTLIIGDFDESMRIIHMELKQLFAQDSTIVTQIKIINMNMDEQ